MKIFNVTIPRQVYMPIIIIVVAFLLVQISKKIISSKFDNKKKKIVNKKLATISVLLKNIIKYAIYTIALLWILKEFGVNTAALTTGVGVVSLVLGLALQDILKDVFAGLSIIVEGQMSIGDWVKVNDFSGTVTYVGLKTTKIQAWTGEIKIIPNRNINDIINYSMDKTLAVVDLSISYETDIEKALKILKVAAANVSSKIENLTEEIKVLGVEKLDDSAVVIRVIGRCDSGSKYVQVQRRIREEFKKVLDKNGIKIPYPQIEVHNET